jgi:hypothetical protein
MGRQHEGLTEELIGWLAQQRMFFVATAPLAADGLLNCSPKGLDTFRVLGPNEVAYLDLTGSGIETAAHLRENGRIVLVFCAFDGPPKIVRLYGIGHVVANDHPDFRPLRERFPDLPGIRAVIQVNVTRVGESCGYAVPRYNYVGERDTLVRWAEAKGNDGLETYRKAKNAHSLDGLPGLGP